MSKLTGFFAAFILPQGGGPPIVPGPNLPDLDAARQVQPTQPQPLAAEDPPPCFTDCDPCPTCCPECTTNNPPVARTGGPYGGNVGQLIQFDGHESFDPDGDAITFHWSFGDGTSLISGESPVHIYGSAGTYSVTLTVTDTHNASDSATTTVIVTGPPPSPTPTATPTPGPAVNNAAFVSQSVTTSMTEGELYPVSITMRNTGTTTWTAAHLYRLAPYTPPNNEVGSPEVPSGNTDWGTSRVSLSKDVPPGAEVTFSFTVVGPYGTFCGGRHIGLEHDFQWRMIQDGVDPFGDPSELAAVHSCGAFHPGPTVSYEPTNHYAVRLEPRNRTGNPGDDLLSRNFNWSTALVNLPGRAGLDLNLSLNYNSLVWTPVNSAYIFDADRGFPGAGFRLGFPTIQGPFSDGPAGGSSYLLISSSGGHVELRDKGAGIYESANSSYLQLIAADGGLSLRDANGAQMTYALLNGEFHCTSVKDRNGNYLTIRYDPINGIGGLGRMTSIVDTLGRTINFNYDANYRLLTITQSWNGQLHTWATFSYGSLTVEPNFRAESEGQDGVVMGLPSNHVIAVLTQVSLDDRSSYQFDYTAWGQVYRVRHNAADGHQLGYVANDLPIDSSTQLMDCPRVSERHERFENWNGGNEAVTTYSFNPESSYEGVFYWENVQWTQATLPDGTKYREYTTASFDSWSRGLVTQTEIYSADDSTTAKKTTVTDWTQDLVNVGYPLNPRVAATTISDSDGNRRRTTYEYTSFGLPFDVFEWGPSDSGDWTLLRRSHTDYELSDVYLARRVIGLPKQSFVFSNEDNWQRLYSKVSYQYDAGGEFIADQGEPVQHDANNFGLGMVEGRGNVTSVRRWDANHETDIYYATVTSAGYNTTGSPIFSRDALNHQTSISYADKFSVDGTTLANPSLMTLAYPTMVTDPDNFSSAIWYNYDFGAMTRVAGPPPQGQAQGAIQTTRYDAAGRVSQVTTINNGAYTRFVYPLSQTIVNQFTTIQEGQGEAYSATVLDGAGRVRAVASDFPNSTGHYSGQFTLYDVMGRAVQTTNPTEMNHTWTAAGDDAVGWYSSSQTYDWKGRPLRTTNTDDTYKEASYGGCGCAGGAMMTLQDEGTMVDGVLKRRTQRSYSDSLGRAVKSEVLNWDGSVYATAVNTYNARDQVTLVRQYQGNDQSGVYQEMTMTYDGFGRLLNKHVPQQTAGTATTYAYNADDTVDSVTDARGARAKYFYNNGRRLVNSIVFSAPSGIEIPSAVAFDYDGAGNRNWMVDGMGRVDYLYDQLSRLHSETRHFNALSGTYTLTYDYTLSGQLKTITEPSGSRADYSYDSTGRLSGVSGVGLGGSQYASSLQYRAWGGLKSMAYGNNTSLSLTYNKRAQITHYSLGGVKAYVNGPLQPEGGDFQYCDDGRVKFASDLRTDVTTSGLHDRAYSYDYAGRLKEAYSGAEARDFVNGTNSGIQDGAFRQTYNYDAWNNLTTRTARFWTEDDSSTDSFNTQSRNPLWDYDADGRLKSTNDPAPNELTYQPLRFTYDASGSRVQSTQTTSRHNPFNWNVIFTTTNTQTESYDGNGLLAKAVFGTQMNTSSHPTTTTYYLRSSLSGAVIAEYDGAGVRQKTYVYAGGQLLVEGNRISDQATQLRWQQVNPLTGDGLQTDAQGNTLERTTVDPLGVNVGDSNPFVPDGVPTNGGDGQGMSQSAIDSMVAGLIPGWGGPKCAVDGMIVGCTLVSGLNSDATEECLDGNCGKQQVTIIARNSAGKIIGRTTIDVLPGQPGWNGHLDGFYSVLNTQRIKFDPSTKFAQDFLRTAADPGQSGIFEAGDGAFRRMQDPDASSRAEISSLMDDILELFKNHHECEGFMNKLLAELKTSTGYDAGSIRDVIENFRKNGIAYRDARQPVNAADQGGGDAGTGRHGVPSISFAPGGTREITAVLVMGEMMHWAGMPNEGGVYQNKFTDEVLANAASKLGVVMSIEQYRHTYPEQVAIDKARWNGRDMAESRVAHGAMDIKCLDIITGMLPQSAKP